MAEMRYDDKVAVITGAGAGLGRLYAHTLAKRGAKVKRSPLCPNCCVVLTYRCTNDLLPHRAKIVVNDMNKDAADKCVAEIKALGGQAAADYHSCVDGEKVVATAIAAFGTVHIIVNNAGVLRDVSFARMTEEQWEIVLQTHLYGTYSMCKAAWSTMRAQEYGRIVNITSVNGLYGQRGQANYSAAKGGIVGFTETLPV